MSTSSIPGCLLGVALEGDGSPHGHASLLQHVLLLEQARQQSTLIAGEWTGSCAREGAQDQQSGILSSPVTVPFSRINSIGDFFHILETWDTYRMPGTVLDKICCHLGVHIPEQCCSVETTQSTYIISSIHIKKCKKKQVEPYIVVHACEPSTL